jgi:hypothetical protein
MRPTALEYPSYREDSLHSVAVLGSSYILHLGLTVFVFPSVFSLQFRFLFFIALAETEWKYSLCEATHNVVSTTAVNTQDTAASSTATSLNAQDTAASSAAPSKPHSLVPTSTGK